MYRGRPEMRLERPIQMSSPGCPPPRKRSLTVILGVGFSLLIGGLGLLLAIVPAIALLVLIDMPRQQKKELSQ